ncbi:hypothetical protein FAES_0537 [Fibrella aestuarina BUZ 2]|uniref:Uncharacterized protein n=1 Tax=Fibrella aestuarina BUZ 2 TaxID=1166018 RepID=I0K345_9BACT|nr:hypothetical protein FAES_0537 [Fibrella aestuarina BUZ 2]
MPIDDNQAEAYITNVRQNTRKQMKQYGRKAGLPLAYFRINNR